MSVFLCAQAKMKAQNEHKHNKKRLDRDRHRERHICMLSGSFMLYSN